MRPDLLGRLSAVVPEAEAYIKVRRSRTWPTPAMKLPGGGHENCPLAVMDLPDTIPSASPRPAAEAPPGVRLAVLKRRPHPRAVEVGEPGYRTLTQIRTAPSFRTVWLQFGVIDTKPRNAPSARAWTS
jgi:hypothetical protein